MKNKDLDKWIKKTLDDGVFATVEDALEVMASLGVLFCQHFKIDRRVFRPDALPLTVETLTKEDQKGEDIFNIEEYDKALGRILRGQGSFWSLGKTSSGPDDEPK